MNLYEERLALEKTAKILAGQDIPVRMEGFAPRVAYDRLTKKPVEIVIPILNDRMDRKLITAIHGAIDHEVGHVLLSDAEDICDDSKDELWHFVHNLVDDPRVNKVQGNTFPGAAVNIKFLYQYMFDNLPGHTKEEVDKLIDSIPLMALIIGEEKAWIKARMQYAVSWIAWLSGYPIAVEFYETRDLDRLYAPWNEKIPEDIKKRTAEAETSEEIRELTDFYYEFFKEIADEYNAEQKKKSEEKGRGGLGSDEEGGESSDSEEGDSDGSTVKETFKDLCKSLEDLAKEAIAAGVTEAFEGTEELFYWTERYTTIITPEDMHLKGDKLAAFHDKCKQVSNYISKDLERFLMSYQRTFYTGGYRSGRLNGSSLWSARTGNERVFSRKHEAPKLDAVVSLLVDGSGSMKRDGKIALACQSAYAFAECLERFRIPFEILVYTNESLGNRGKMQADWARFVKENPDMKKRVVTSDTPNELYVIKSFNQAFGQKPKQALSEIPHGAMKLWENEDSVFVRYAMERLSVMPQKRKALFVFNDGAPSFSNYEYVASSQKMLRHLTSNAKTKYGVDVYGIGIQSSDVMKYYDNYVVVNKLEDLPNALFGYLRNHLVK